MNIYLLKRLDNDAEYDEARGFVVRAASGDAARGIVATADWRSGGGPGDEGARTWLESELTSCEEIAEGVEGASGVVLRDFSAG